VDVKRLKEKELVVDALLTEANDKNRMIAELWGIYVDEDNLKNSIRNAEKSIENTKKLLKDTCDDNEVMKLALEIAKSPKKLGEIRKYLNEVNKKPIEKASTPWERYALAITVIATILYYFATK